MSDNRCLPGETTRHGSVHAEMVDRIALRPGYAISPNLPAGLAIDPGSGVIGGTPADVSPSTTYAIVGSNAAGRRGPAS
ncbi:Ig domain-containing protein [Robbsia betulipollinis]|uniref:Ig domain-containing protein n=1 Tax=Robbsia betulipollinis TaxID=2981849 RepID=UPI003D7B6B52